jgi:hypothetical protein
MSHKLLDAVNTLHDLGKTHQLGGDGQPVGVVVVYKNGAFINASWGGVPEDRMTALVDAAAGEGLKEK